ncbi:AAA domain-containing protein [Streptomyces sp. NPDC007983]|uniref:AAA domain-containing protein n=1 Tax=Streptomyces sp. NPDC007983 TaxID=3364800 RepID=UPI0036E97635
MTSPHPTSPQQQADHTVRTVLGQLPILTHRGLVVDSPPGAGKTTLAAQAAATLARSAPCIVIAQTNNQVDELLKRLARLHPDLRLARLTAEDHNIPADLHSLPGLRISTSIKGLEKRDVIAGTAMKWATVTDRTWPWAVIDEVYQMRSDLLLRTAPLFDKALFVGDPGQLDPFSAADTHRWAGLPHDPLANAVTVLLDNNRDLPLHTLPASWRLPPSAIPLVGKAFYPLTPFHAGHPETNRTLAFAATGIRSPLDKTIDHAARTGWALLELPARFTHRLDTEALHAAAALAERLLIRHAAITCEDHPQGRDLEPRDIAIGTVHRDQARRIRALLAHDPRLHAVTVDTANRLQGREFSVTIALHPLSGRSDASAFHLEAGRLCVLTTRHRHACIVIARAGIDQLLDAHGSNGPVHLGVTSKIPDSWGAHHTVLEHLAPHTIGAR